MDAAAPPVPTGASPTYIAFDNTHVIVSNLSAAENHLSILSVATHAVVHQVYIDGGSPLGSVITPDGNGVLIDTAGGRMAHLDITTGKMRVVALWRSNQGISRENRCAARTVAANERRGAAD